MTDARPTATELEHYNRMIIDCIRLLLQRHRELLNALNDATLSPDVRLVSAQMLMRIYKLEQSYGDFILHYEQRNRNALPQLPR